MSDKNKEHSTLEHVYAVVRIDPPINQENPQNSIAVVKVFASEEAAERDLTRLKNLNEAKGCRYFLFTTRMVP